MQLITPATTAITTIPIDQDVTNIELEALLPGEKICLDLNGKFSLIVQKEKQVKRENFNMFATGIFSQFWCSNEAIYGDTLLLAYEETAKDFDASIFVEV